jgi:type I restriction enzyme S subunit
MKKIKLGDVLDIRRGASLSGKFYSNEGNLIRLTLGNFNYPRGGFQENFSKENIFFVGTVNPVFILKAGDIITPLTEQVSGLLGETATIPESDKYIQSGDIGLVIPDEVKIDKRFAYYLVSSPIVRKQLDSATQQTKIRHTSPNAIKSCTTWIPEDISTQRRIAEFLDALDDKIALNKKINATLEAMAKTLYDYWFVQFDFPDENGKPYKTSGGKMIYNAELGREIPIGWEVGNVLSLANVFAGGDRPNVVSEIKTNLCEVPIYSNGTEENSLYGFTNNATVLHDSITISARGNIGYTAFRQRGFVPIIRLIVVTPYDSVHLEYIYQCLKNYSHRKNGSVQQQLTVPQVESIRIIIPPKNLVSRYHELVKPSIKKFFQILNENRRLAESRDWLLPLLMNGQIDFKEKI